MNSANPDWVQNCYASSNKYMTNGSIKYQVVKVSPGGLLPLAPLAPLTPLAPLAPSRSSHSSCSLSLPITPLAPLAPSHSPHSLSPSHSPLAPNGQCRVGVCYTMFWGPHHLCGGKGWEGARWARGEWDGARGSKGSKREWDRAREGEGSEINVMLGFKASTTSGRKNFDDDI